MKGITLALVFVAATASAQSVTAYRVALFPAATLDPLTATPLAETPDLPVASICGRPKPPVPPPIVVDPTDLAWTDPVNPTTLDCVTNQATLFATLPAAGSATVAGYVATVQAVSGSSLSPRMLATNRFSLTNGPPPGKFVLGQSVKPTVFDAWVFDAPNGAMIGTQLLSAGVIGTVTGGPGAGVNNLTMWLVDFASGADGWVWEDRLIGVAGVAHPAPTGVGIRR